jgi:hypothetical protein
VTYEQLVPDFMQAVHEIGQHTGGRAHVGEIMAPLGLNVSSAVDIRMPTTEDDCLYMRLARYCEEMHYIEKEADRCRIAPPQRRVLPPKQRGPWWRRVFR